MKQYDVVALGELLIDFTEAGSSAQGHSLMEANPGGAPANVLAMLSRLGHKTAFIGKVGKDMFGRQLAECLTLAGIDNKGLLVDADVNTTLAFVKNNPQGEREFSFYRNPGADCMLSVDDVYAQMDLLKNCEIFHFGSLSMTHKDCQEATKMAVTAAKAAGALISYDPNLRASLWTSLEDAREQIAWGLSHSDVVKIADDELVWFTGEADCEVGANKLRAIYPNLQLLFVSLAERGSMAFWGDQTASAKAYLRPDTIDTTGAGDGFFGCMLHYVLEEGMISYKEADMKKALTLANVAAAMVTTKKGAMDAMPTMEQILTTYLAGKIQGKQPGCKKHPMHLCEHTGEEPCQFHKREQTDMYTGW